MSVWTHVDGFVRSKSKISKETLKRIFGEEMVLEYPNRRDFMSRSKTGELLFDDEGYEAACVKAEEQNSIEWDAYAANEDTYMPCGSEGTLQYEPMKKTGNNYEFYEYGISGALRDFSDEMGIINWFKSKSFELQKEVAPEDPWALHCKISVSSGVGQLTWEINDPNDCFEP